MDEALQAEKGEWTAGGWASDPGTSGERWWRESPRSNCVCRRNRQWRFRTEVFERYPRSEKALVTALMEIYLPGVSTRKIMDVTEELCGHEFSSATISRMVRTLMKELEKSARRRLEEHYRYLILRKADDDCLMELRWNL